MKNKEFEKEVMQNRPRMALMELIPVLENIESKLNELFSRISALEDVKTAEPPLKETETKKAPVKKTAAKKTSAAADKDSDTKD